MNNSLLLRSYVDLAGKPGEQNLDVTYRSSITSAFQSKNIENYFKEIQRFFKYCLQDVILEKFLQLEENTLPLVFQGSFYSRVDTVFSIEVPPVCNFLYTWGGGEADSVAFDLLDAEFGFHTLIDRHLPLKSGFSYALPLNVDLRYQIRNMLLEMYRSQEVKDAGRKNVHALLMNDDAKELCNAILDLAIMAKCSEVELLSSFVDPCFDRWFGFVEDSLPVFGFGQACPEPLRGILLPNRQWLEQSGVTLFDLVELLLSLLLDPAARALHFFHFGLGYERDVLVGTEDIFAVHGDLLILDYGNEALPEAKRQGIYLLMQEAMSSMAILENGLVQGGLEAELARAEATRKVLRKMHHSLSGPISTAFNSFALMQPTLVEGCSCPEDLESLGEVYSTLRSAKSQTVSWTAFSNPEGLQGHRVQASYELHDLIQSTLTVLQLHFGKSWGYLEPDGPWPLVAFLDRGLIEVALWQMLKNAYDHLKVSPASSHGEQPLRIKFEKEDKFFTLSVWNAGLECQPSLIATLQDAVRNRVDAPSAKADGQGLGLTTCAEIAAAHGGTFHILVENKLFCARLKLPLKG